MKCAAGRSWNLTPELQHRNRLWRLLRSTSRSLQFSAVRTFFSEVQRESRPALGIHVSATLSKQIFIWGKAGGEKCWHKHHTQIPRKSWQTSIFSFFLFVFLSQKTTSLAKKDTSVVCGVFYRWMWIISYTVSSPETVGLISVYSTCPLGEKNYLVH